MNTNILFKKMLFVIIAVAIICTNCVFSMYAQSIVNDDTAEYVPSPEDFEEVALSGVISVQEALAYKYKNLSIDATIAINSELKFDSCTILLDEASSLRVVGTLIFENE